ncbi:MAG: hypothetical protein JXA14_24520 [Anaerolineae bacterium]|nr:hypothetical protein [Anaerolineae bacterium]
MTQTKRQILISLALASGLLLTPAHVIADDAVTVVENTANYSFAKQVTFTLEATIPAQVTKLYLFFTATGSERTESFEVPFRQEDETLNASYLHDLRLSPLPPFDTVTFWWKIEYGGESYTTEEKSFKYVDDRFAWKQLDDEENHITVHWIKEQGDPTFGQAALDITRTSLKDINAELRAPLPESTAIYIYDTQENLNGAMVLAGRDWASGQAHPDLGVIVIAIPQDGFYTSRMERYIPHEVTHLLVYQIVTPEGYKYVPEWLDEGLATANEQLPTPEHALMLEEARLQRQLIPLQDLCVPFPPDAQTAYLAYAQSGSVVKYIRERYGAQGIRDLLAAYANGASCTSGVEEALGTSLNALEIDWRASFEPLPQLEPQTPLPTWVQQVGPLVGLWLLGLLVAIPMIGRISRRR